MVYDESSINIDNLGLGAEKVIDRTEQKLEMERKILEAREAERRKIARDIHDGPAQSLAAILITLDLLASEISETADCQQLKQQLSQLKDIAKEGMDEMRQILFDLKPTSAEKDSLLSLLDDYFTEIKAKFNFTINLETVGSPQIYPVYIQTALFRIVQEAINNIRKHAGVSKAQIVMTESREQLKFLIKDEGKGFNKERELNKAGSYGLVGMKERVELLEGTIEIISEPGAGTQILIEIPLKGRHNIGEGKSYNSR